MTEEFFQISRSKKGHPVLWVTCEFEIVGSDLILVRPTNHGMVVPQPIYRKVKHFQVFELEGLVIVHLGDIILTNLSCRKITSGEGISINAYQVKEILEDWLVCKPIQVPLDLLPHEIAHNIYRKVKPSCERCLRRELFLME